MPTTDKTLTIEDLQIGKLYRIKSIFQSDDKIITIFVIKKYKVKNKVKSAWVVKYMLPNGKISHRYNRDFQNYTTKELK